MAKRTKKTPAPATVLATPAEEPSGQLAFLDPVKIPGFRKGMARHVALDHELQARSKRIGQDFWVVLRICDELVSFKYYERLGFEDAASYFQKKVPHLTWPTVRRYLGILEGVRRLPQRDREPAMRALQGVGVGKASAIAPILGQSGEGWEKWTKAAKALGEEDLRATVKAAMGAPGKAVGGTATTPAEQRGDAKWFRYTVHQIESFAPDAAKEVEEVFEAGRVAFKVESYWSVFFSLVQDAKVEILHRAKAATDDVPPAETEAPPA